MTHGLPVHRQALYVVRHSNKRILHFKSYLMKNNLKFLFTVITLIAFQLTIFAQQPNYTGTWILNFKKSKLEHQAEGLTSKVFIIKQDGDNFSLTQYNIFGDNKKKISFEMIADGMTRRVKILFKGKLEKKENGLQATLWRKNFLNIVNYKFGNNPNEFVADEVFTGKPQNHHSIWVFDREILK
jgi:hypothetical protein